jgi:hypothetical protein
MILGQVEGESQDADNHRGNLARQPARAGEEPYFLLKPHKVSDFPLGMTLAMLGCAVTSSENSQGVGR